MFYLSCLIIGLILGTILLFYVRSGSKSREKRILSAGLIVAACIYAGFAVVWGNAGWILIEAGGIPFFGSFAWLAHRYSYNWLAAGWGIHIAWDGLIHIIGAGRVIAPEWYVVTCISFDLIVAGYILFSNRTDFVSMSSSI